MKIFAQKDDARNFFNIKGNFGELKSEVKISDNTYTAKNEKVIVTSEIKEYEQGVSVRCGKVKNISEETVTLNTLSSKFTFDGGEYEVYTQSNTWQNESEGEWQPLVTSVSARCRSVRGASEATPFMALWSEQQNRGMAFHLVADSAWEMRISRTYFAGEVTFIEADFGVLSEGLALEILPGEEVSLPEIIFYEAINKTDLDCWKLHTYLNKEYPRKTMPVVYNSWLYKFDRFTYDDLLKQIPKAKELGAEYFVVDAGWFGKGDDWWPDRGDWEENLTFGFRGEMREFAEEVRKQGLKFGFWLEPECASNDAEIVKAHPEYFCEGLGSMFIDFVNTEARQYIFDKTCELIDRFGAEYVKFDFNADMKFDKYNSGFVRYYQGHNEFMKKLKERYPDLYILSCGSGGFCMTINDAKLSDSFWPTDNQSTPFGLKIFKNSILRLAPQWIDAWVSIRSAEKFSYACGTDDMADKIFSTNDASWTSIVSVDENTLCGFMMGRPVGLSFDLTLLSDKHFDMLKNYIADFKCDRNFWQNAVCHILCDTKTMLVLEYRDEKSDRVEIVAFADKAKQMNITVRPVVDENATYEIAGVGEMSGKSITKDGVDIQVMDGYTTKFLTLKKRS